MNYSISILSSFNFLFLALFAVAALLLGKAIYTLKKFPELKKQSIKELIVGGLVTFVIFVIFVVVPLIAGISVEKNSLSLRLPTGFTFVTYTSDDIISAKVVDLTTQPEYNIYSKVVGTEIRDYREGIFKLGTGKESTVQAEVFLNGTKALYVETKDKPLLLGPDKFDNFVENFSENIKNVE